MERDALSDARGTIMGVMNVVDGSSLDVQEVGKQRSVFLRKAKHPVPPSYGRKPRLRVPSMPAGRSIGAERAPEKNNLHLPLSQSRIRNCRTDEKCLHVNRLPAANVVP